MTLPPSEIERIEADAKNYGEKSHDLYSTTLNASQISYFAGAKAEAVRGREMATGFAKWVGHRNWFKDQRRKDVWFAASEVYDENNPDENKTTAELLDLYLKENEK